MRQHDSLLWMCFRAVDIVASKQKPQRSGRLYNDAVRVTKRSCFGQKGDGCPTCQDDSLALESTSQTRSRCSCQEEGTMGVH